MNFNTLAFPLFFAVCAFFCWVCPSKLRPYGLLLASYGFYCYQPGNRKLIFFLLFVTVVTWICGLLLNAKDRLVRQIILWCGILSCLAPLIFFKQFSYFYTLFFGTKPAADKILFPLGISYFTFQGLSYLIDRYRKKYRAERNLFRYALFVSFFPCIFTGPIERYDHLMPQLCKRPHFQYNMAAGGAFRMLWGYFKKMVLADHLVAFVEAYYMGATKTISGPVAATAAILFTLQLYLEFSGSCDMAIGGARMMGIELLENFKNPFLATSFADLWRRWHISLTSWFRDYIYISLGGNRKGLPRWAINTLIVFGVSGIWHGLDWGYLFWGLACGAIVVLEQLPARIRRLQQTPVHTAVPATVGAPAPVITPSRTRVIRRADNTADGMQSFSHASAHTHTQPSRREMRQAKNKHPFSAVTVWLRRALVFTEFALCFILFAQSLYASGFAPSGFAALFSGWSPAGFAALQTALQAAKLTGTIAYVLVLGIGMVLAIESRGDVAVWIRRQHFVVRWTLYYVLLLAILFFGVFGKSSFIYNNY